MRQELRVMTALVAASLLTFGCAPRTDRETLVGRYETRYPFGREVVTLKTDSTYHQQVELARDGDTPEILTNKGRWVLVGSEKVWDDRVRLENCLVVNDGLGKLRRGYASPLPGGRTLPVGREHVFWGALSLGDEDSFPLVKQPPEARD